MRKYAYLKEPYECNEDISIYKVMFHTQEDGVILYQYCSPDAVMSSFDLFYHTVEEVYEDWDFELDERGWIDIDDPLPDCMGGAFLPIRVKGKNCGMAQWGKYEILENGQWVDYDN